MLEFHSGGRRVSPDEFVENLKREAIESAMRELQERAHAAASSIIDPDTGSMRGCDRVGKLAREREDRTDYYRRPCTEFSEWPPRRLNSALNYLQEAKLVNPNHAIGQGPWTMFRLWVTDRTRRFARERG